MADAYVYNKNNELLGNIATTYEYDANGNTTAKKLNGSTVFGYNYNVEDRMSSVVDWQGGEIANYGYDPFGRRLWKDVGGSRTYYQYADEGLIGEFDANGQEIKSYGYWPHGKKGDGDDFMRFSTM
ncbi:MAG: RHS repeat protein [Deltaproteobacteria bacterium]|nr:RHS repeat protein [Deltaproteobacteria bacterium]